jgi:hypothetical protein
MQIDAGKWTGVEKEGTLIYNSTIINWINLLGVSLLNKNPP